MLWKIVLSDKIFQNTYGKEAYVPLSEANQSPRATFSDRDFFKTVL